MKPKPVPGNGDIPQHVLNKRLTEARTDETRAREHTQRTREKMHRLHLAKARGEVVEKELVQKQAAFLFVAMRQKMLAAPLAYHRKLLACKDAHSMMHDLLRELHDMPRKITDPRWIETLEENDDV
jgi:hypothetical protein